jgi:hypothetical protein
MVSRVVLFTIGGLVGAFLDHLHVSFGVLGYPHPVLFDQPLWVVPLFGFATLGFVGGHTRFRAPGEKRPQLAEVTGAVAVFALAYFASAAGRHRPLVLLLLLAFSWAMLAAGPGFTRRAVYCLSLAIFGTAFEIFLSRVLGGFEYRGARPLGGVPVWLPALYLHAGLLTRKIDLAFFAPTEPLPATAPSPRPQELR